MIKPSKGLLNLGNTACNDFPRCDCKWVECPRLKRAEELFCNCLNLTKFLFRCYFLKLIKKAQSFSVVFSFQTKNKRRNMSVGISVVCPASVLSASVSAAEDFSSPAGWVPTWPEFQRPLAIREEKNQRRLETTGEPSGLSQHQRGRTTFQFLTDSALGPALAITRIYLHQI